MTLRELAVDKSLKKHKSFPMIETTANPKVPKEPTFLNKRPAKQYKKMSQRNRKFNENIARDRFRVIE